MLLVPLTTVIKPQLSQRLAHQVSSPVWLLRNLSYESIMKESSQPDKPDKGDEMRECHGKEASDVVCCSKEACYFVSKKGVADDLMPHILNLYGSRATPRDFEIYAPDASFEDPLMCARGMKQIKSAFYSLSKVFSESRIEEYSIKENVKEPGKHEILIDNKQHYMFLGRSISMISLIKLYVKDGKVVRHEDWWDKKPIRNRETSKVPIVGRFKEIVRRGSMLATHAMMRFGKDPTT